MSQRKPFTVKELTEEARHFVFDSRLSLARWINVCKSLLQQADVYYYEHDFEQAYILYSRFTLIVVEYLPDHKEMEKSHITRQNKAKIKLLKLDTMGALDKMEEIKPIIEQRVAAWDYEQKEKARMIQYEREAQINHYQAQYREAQRRQSQGITDREYEKMLFDIQKLQTPGHKSSSKPSSSCAVSTSPSNSITYPSTQYKHSSPVNGTIETLIPSKPPPLPPLPPLESTESVSPVNTFVEESAPSSSPPSINDSKAVLHRIRATTEGGEPLRTVFLPTTLRPDFLRVAQTNTDHKLETCGMLCGKLSLNAFFITHLVIPHQESTPDTCATVHEEILFDYLDTNDLILLGWIHTHPTQSCFMSSVDLHTQSSYQLMLKESIAIVCAPTQTPSWDIYRLTDPNGTSIIRRCPKSSFHPHPEPNIYKSTMRHGHVVMGKDLPYELVDLRKIKPSDD